MLSITAIVKVDPGVITSPAGVPAFTHGSPHTASGSHVESSVTHSPATTLNPATAALRVKFSSPRSHNNNASCMHFRVMEFIVFRRQHY